MRLFFMPKKGECPLIEPHKDMYMETDVTDITLHFIQDMYGPIVKDWLLLPGPVPLMGVQHDNILDSIAKLG